MRFSWALVLAIVLAFGGGTACSSSGGEGGGGEVNSDAALHGLMQAVAFDLAKVLAAVAPAYGEASLKAPGDVTTTSCPQGGTARFTESGGGTGTLVFEECALRGVNVSGELAGYLETEPALGGMAPAYVHATNMYGSPLTVAGAYSASLNVQRLDLSANLPEPTDFFTYWEIHATTVFGQPLCAWSGSASCDDMMEF